MSLLNGSGEPSAEELQAMQEEAEKNREERGMAQQLASSGAMEGHAETHAAPGYWDVIGKPDIGRGEEYEDNLEPFLQTEFASTFALGNISREEYQSWMWAIETEFWTAKNEFHDAESNLGDDDLRVMYGEDRPTLTNEHARRLRSAMQVKKFMASLSVDARGLRSGTEIHAVAKQESADDGEEEGGRLAGISKWLSG
jgi:hypothetical protein